MNTTATLRSIVAANTQIPGFFRSVCTGEVVLSCGLLIEWCLSPNEEYLLFIVGQAECELSYDGSWTWRDVPEPYRAPIRKYVGQY